MAASEEDRNRSGEAVLPLQEEVLRVEKREVVTDRVRIHSTTETVEEFVEVDLSDEQLQVTRVPIGREVTEIPAVRTEGDLTIVPVLEEVLKVEKRLVLTEELHIRRSRATQSVRIPVVVRKQRAVIERDGRETREDNTEEQDNGL